ncbi:unnamed protein product [Caenorhabditis brenneri]
MLPSPRSLTKTERCASKTRIRRWEYWTPGSARRRLDFDESLTVVTSSQSSPDLVPALELPRAMGSVSSPEQMSYSGEQEEEEKTVQDPGDALDTQKEVVDGSGSEDVDDFDSDSPENTSSKSSLCVISTPTSKLPRAMASVSSPEQMSYSGEQEEEEKTVQDPGDAVDTQKEVVEGNGNKDEDDFDSDSPKVNSSKYSLCVIPTPISELPRDMFSTPSTGMFDESEHQEEEPESVISEAEEDAEEKTGSDEDSFMEDEDVSVDDEDNYLDGDGTEDSGDDGDDLDSETPDVVHHREERYGLRPRRTNEWFGMSDEDRNANQELVDGILGESNRDEKVSGAAHSLLQRVSETFVTTVFKDG